MSNVFKDLVLDREEMEYEKKSFVFFRLLAKYFREDQTKFWLALLLEAFVIGFWAVVWYFINPYFYILLSYGSSEEAAKLFEPTWVHAFAPIIGGMFLEFGVSLAEKIKNKTLSFLAFVPVLFLSYIAFITLWASATVLHIWMYK